MFIVKDALCEGTKWHIRDLPKNPAADPYFPINQAAIDLKEHGDNLHVELKTMTPNFQRFEIQIDGGRWMESIDAVEWKPHSGVNELRARTVNAFGVPGPVSFVQITSN